MSNEHSVASAIIRLMQGVIYREADEDSWLTLDRLGAADVSTRYALKLFATLGLQLLIVTPLQKVHVIEPYVKAIGFVDNPTGTFSRLRTMTIEEYRTRRDGRRP